MAPKDDRLMGDKASSRAQLMAMLMEVYPLPKRKEMALFLRSIDEFETDETFFVDEQKGTINFAYHVSILMRCANSCLVHATADSLRLETIEFLNDPAVVRKFLAVLALVPCLTCNVAAKFMRVMSQALTLSPKSQNDPDIVEKGKREKRQLLVYDMLSVYVERLCQPTLQLLKQTKDVAITQQQQRLLTEMSRLMSVICNNVPYITFSDRHECQVLCVEACLNRLAPRKVLMCLVHMSLYDLQVDTGSMH